MNARSLARHYAMLAGGGALDGVRLMSQERVALAASPQPEDPETAQVRWWTGHGLGYTRGGGPGPRAGWPEAFSYEGVGTIGFADPSRRFAFGLLKTQLNLSTPDETVTASVVVRAIEDTLGIA